MICSGARLCVAFSFIIMAIYNYINLEELSEYADTIVLVPYAVRRLFPILIPFGEVSLAIGLIFSKQKGTWLFLTYCILWLFTGYLIYAVINPWESGCNYCSGLLRLAENIKSKNIFYLIRSIFLLVLIAISLMESKFENKHAV